MKAKRIKATDVKNGDTIRFRVACRWGWERGPRKVKETTDRAVAVRCAGCSRFWVRLNEITHINGVEI